MEREGEGASLLPVTHLGGSAKCATAKQERPVLFELSRSGLLAILLLLRILNIFPHRDVLAGLVLLLCVRLLRIGLSGVDEWIVLIGLTEFSH
jgi:hypothetical protein